MGHALQGAPCITPMPHTRCRRTQGMLDPEAAAVATLNPIPHPHPHPNPDPYSQPSPVPSPSPSTQP